MEVREGNRPPAPDDDELKTWIAGEVAQWHREGLIRDDQARLILARYGLAGDDTATALGHRRIAQALAILGAILVGAGVILVVGANWESIPRLLRLLLLMGLIAFLYGSGFILAHSRRSHPAIGRALIFLGSLIWGASIFLVGQSYHVGAEGGERSAVLMWLLGILPLAYVLGSPEHAGLAVILLWSWYGWTLGNHPARFGTPLPYLFLVTVAGTALYSTGWLHRINNKLAPVGGWFLYAGLLATLLGIYGLSFDIYSSNAYPSTAGPDAFLWGLAVTTLGAGLALSAAVLTVPWRRGGADRWEGAVVLGVALAGTVCFIAAAGGMSAEAVRIPAIVIANVVLLALECGLVALGWHRMQPVLVNVGLAAFFIHLMTRYFDLIGTMLSGGFAFITAGLVLLGAGALLERQRRRLLETMAGRAAE
ncbi:MAG: hypothetical protein KatS3mg024_0207 [Armatimonadota bacterium]|nr:MAG: hypothetical protein KatS3mg024_0207 [Armatimonadota bacterium]